MNETVSSFYARHRTLGLLLVGGLMMILSFLWYLPGAYHASNMGEYHVYSFSEFRFNNVIAMYVNHNLDQYSGPGFIVKGTGIEYPPLMSMLIRAAAGVKPVHDVPIQVYRSGTPQIPSGPETQTNSVVAYTWINYAVDFVFGVLCIYLLSLWPGARPWVFVLSPLLFLFTGYNWDIIPIAITLAGALLLLRSTQHPDPGQAHNRWLEAGGYALLALGIWFKLFPVVFLIAALVDRLRRKDYRAVALGVGVVSILSLIINVPMALLNFDSWYFYLWMHQNRATELSLWYWIMGGMDPAIVGRPDVTSAINVMSLFMVGAGGIVITALAWKSPRVNVIMPLGCTLLVWWLTVNKVYDPNFDLWLLFALAVLAAPFWLTATITMASILWWVMTFVGLHIAIQPNSAEISNWLIGHGLFTTLLVRLATLGIMFVWTCRTMLTAEAPEVADQFAVQPAAARVKPPSALLPGKGETQTAL